METLENVSTFAVAVTQATKYEAIDLSYKLPNLCYQPDDCEKKDDGND